MSPSPSLKFSNNAGRSGALIVVFKLRDDGSILLQFSEPHYPIRDTRYYILELSWFQEISENYLGQGWTTAEAICELEPLVKRQLAILDLIRVYLLKNKNFQEQLKYDVEDQTNDYHMSIGGAYSVRTWPSGELGWSSANAIEQSRMRELLRIARSQEDSEREFRQLYLGSVSDGGGPASTTGSALSEISDCSSGRAGRRQRRRLDLDLSSYYSIVSIEDRTECWNWDLEEQMRGSSR